MNPTLFSIMVPVYNTEAYLRQCLESILAQTYQNYEVILANDGSTDGSGRICDEYMKLDQRFRVFHKSNEGSLQTRRFLIQKSSGDWLLFLDSDDYWESNLLETVESAINKFDVDLILYRYRRISNNGKRIINEDLDVFMDETVFEKKDHEELFMSLVAGSRLRSLWSKAVKRNIVDVNMDYSVYGHVKGDDYLQSIAIFANTKKAVYLNHVLYNYRMSNNSITRNYRMRYVADNNLVRTVAYDTMNKLGYCSPKNEKAFLRKYYSDILITCYNIAGIKADYCEKIECFNNLKAYSLFQRSMEIIPIQYLGKRERKIVKLLLANKYDALIRKSTIYWIIRNIARRLKKIID